ncbi:Effector cfem1 [Fusarium chlamydosporum]
MKYSVAFVALAAAVSAQSLADVPKCAIPCLDKAIESETKCETTDLACVCKNFSDVRSAATSCVIDECGSDVAINEVLPATEKLCKSPPKESEAASTSVKVVTTTSAVAVETTVAETTTVPPVVPTTTAVVPPVVESPSSPMATPTKGGNGGNGGGSSSGSEPAPTNVGENSAAGLKGLGALAMAAFAVLAL